MAVPRRIILSHESAYLFKDCFRKCYDVLKGLHPDCDIRFFSASERREFIYEHYRELLDLYDYYPRNIQRADLFRVLAVRKLGGFYLDLDVLLTRRLDDLCAEPLVFAREWKMSSEQYYNRYGYPPASDEDLFQVGNYGFGAEPQHWFMKEVIDEMLRRAAAVDVSTMQTDDVFFSTGPDVLNSVFARNRVRLAKSSRVLDTGPEFQWFQFGLYGTHLMAGSWGAS